MKTAPDRLLFCLLLLIASGWSNRALALNPNNTNLTFMFIMSSGQYGFNSSGVIPAADIALEDINNSPDVLPGYNLIYDSIRDSQVLRSHTYIVHFNSVV